MGVIADAYKRMLTALLPPGRIWRLIGDSGVGDLLAGCSDELERLHGRADDLFNESDPSTAVELLPEYESELDLDEASTTAERQARVTGRLVARQKFRPIDFQVALAPLLGQDSADVVVIEHSRAFAVSVDDDTEIYKFFVYRDPAEPGDYFVESAQELVDRIKPTHTAGYVIESIDFLCDDEFSLCDRDILGA